MNDQMIEGLRSGLKQMKIAQGAQEQMAARLISELPEDKRGEASKLFNKAKKGNVDISELMAFASNISTKDREELENNAKKVNDKAEEVGMNSKSSNKKN